MATRRANLVARLSLEDREFRRGMSRSEANAEKFRKKIAAVGKTIAGAFAVGAVVSFGKVLLAEFDRIGKISQRLNLSTDAVQGLAFAAETAGATSEQLFNALTRLERKSSEIGTNRGIQDALKELKIDAESFSQLNLEMKFLRLSDAFKNADDRGKAFAALFKLLEDDAKTLLPLLEQGAAGITKTADSISKATDEQIKKVEQANDAWKTFVTTLKVQVAPELALLADGLGGVAQALAGIENIRANIRQTVKSRTGKVPSRFKRPPPVAGPPGSVAPPPAFVGPPSSAALPPVIPGQLTPQQIEDIFQDQDQSKRLDRMIEQLELQGNLLAETLGPTE